MDRYHQVLKKYWGYSTFRPLQLDIITAVAGGKDTLGLMPTGGGKSLTFQVPALITNGICLVITPLIALMKDQVENLRRLNIKALAIYSGMSRDEIDVTLNNAIYGDYKFLYISPERIGTEIFRARIQNMPVNLITVDEAHCISQWGYDFRPSYLKIAELREFLPDIPVLALTATATPQVVEDIQDKLKFGEKNVLRKSFERKNLAYIVKESENKMEDLLKITKKIPGSGIIYVRSRKKTKEIALLLRQNKVPADYYHAGLKHEIRDEKQLKWTDGQTRIIVATNAFGMGIDKGDVRFVLHVDLPDSLEAYFQEAGRAGRDEKNAWAILLYNSSDNSIASQRIAHSFPEIKTIKSIYQALGSYLKVPYGGGKNMSFDFNLGDFAANYKLSLLTAFNSLKILESEGYLVHTEELNNPSRVFFTLNREDLYKFQVANASFDAFIKLILRSYSGIFSDYVAVDELSLAKKAGVSIDVVYNYLNRLSNLGIIRYIPQKRSPLIIYTEERLDDKTLVISRENYQNRKERFIERLKAVIEYASGKDKCRSQQLIEYFGETNTQTCGICDVCRIRKEKEINQQEFNMISDEIKATVDLEPRTTKYLVEMLPFKNKRVLEVINWLVDNHKLIYSKGDKLIWNN